MVIFACTPYFKELIHHSDKEKTKILFKTACRVFAPQLQAINAAAFCKEIGVGDDYIPLFYKYTKDPSNIH
jgi:hypothetical protein